MSGRNSGIIYVRCYRICKKARGLRRFCKAKLFLHGIKVNVMKKLFTYLFSLALAVIFCLQTACVNKNQSNVPSVKPPEPPTPADPSSPQESEKDLWDVSDVDISHIGKNNRLIAFTFDDGPTELTSDLLNAFEKFNSENPTFTAHATLFTLGAKISDTNAAVLTRAVQMNFELGNHTYTHPNLNKLSDSEVIAELKKTDDKLRVFDKKAVHLVRPAGGHADKRVLTLYKTTFINWSPALDVKDYESSTSANGIYDTVSSNLLDGGIVLMHQGYEKTVNAVKRLLPDLKSLGFQVVSVSELIKFYNVKAKIGALYNDFID